MKKLLFSAVALATLLCASCQREGLELSGDNAVIFTVEAPGALGTKAFDSLADGCYFADGLNVNELHYAVYMTNDGLDYSLEDAPEKTHGPLIQGVTTMSERAATVKLDLLRNQEYTIIFWAQVKDAGHYEVGDLRTISMNTTPVADPEALADAAVVGNDESRAAFYQVCEFNTRVQKVHNVTLYRPFAQLNLLTTKESLLPKQDGVISQNYAIDVVSSEVTVSGLSTTFSPIAPKNPVAATSNLQFSMQLTPEKQGQQYLEVNGVEYPYVSMNYFFVPAGDALVEVSYAIKTNPGENNITNTITQVPVKENFRTNVIGNLLTTATTFEIVVDQNFNEPAEEVYEWSNVEVSSDDAAVKAALAAGADHIALGTGSFIIPNSAQNKTLYFKGTGSTPEETRIATNSNGSYEGCNYALDGSTVTFENISINTPSSTYIGYARCKGTYKNCVINGTFTLYDNSVFENCTFNVSGDVYNIWTWGAPKATFKNCTFNSDGKAMLLYGQPNTKLTIDNCVFNDNGGLADLKAAIEIGNDYNSSYELIVNNTTVNGYEINDKGINTGTTLWGNKNSMPQEKLNVVVDGVDVY